MNNLYLELVDSRKEIDVLHDLINMVWTQYYGPLMGEGKVQRFLALKQSKDRIQEEIAEGETSYHFIRSNETKEVIGYLAYHFEKDSLVIDRLYLIYTHRGQGLFNEILSYFRQQATKKSLSKIKIWINEENKAALTIFKHEGFKEMDTRRIPLDQGYVLKEIGLVFEI